MTHPDGYQTGLRDAQQHLASAKLLREIENAEQSAGLLAIVSAMRANDALLICAGVITDTTEIRKHGHAAGKLKEVYARYPKLDYLAHFHKRFAALIDGKSAVEYRDRVLSKKELATMISFADRFLNDGVLRAIKELP